MDDKIKDAFKLLEEVDTMTLNEVQQLFSTINNEYLSVLSKAFLAVPVTNQKFNPTEFAEILLKCREAKKLWGRKLGDVIILSDEVQKTEGAKKAIELLSNFVDECPASFYKKNAENQIRYYREKYDAGI